MVFVDIISSTYVDQHAELVVSGV